MQSTDHLELHDSITGGRPAMLPIEGQQCSDDMRFGFDANAVIMHSPDFTRMTTVTETAVVRGIIDALTLWVHQKEAREG